MTQTRTQARTHTMTQAGFQACASVLARAGRPLFRFALPGLLVMLLTTACALSGNQRSFEIMAPQIENPVRNSTPASERILAVARPRADRSQDTRRILVRSHRSLLPWSGAAWADAVPDLLQSALVEYLDGGAAMVVRHGSLTASLLLDVELRRFEFVDQDGRLSASLAMLLRLMDETGTLRAHTRMELDAPAEKKTLDAAVAAMETVLQTLLERSDAWLLEQLSTLDAGA